MARRYGLCPVCGLLYRIRKDGTVGRHYTDIGHWRNVTGHEWPCSGEGQPAKLHTFAKGV